MDLHITVFGIDDKDQAIWLNPRQPKDEGDKRGLVLFKQGSVADPGDEHLRMLRPAEISLDPG